jgi:hypothetical protein
MLQPEEDQEVGTRFPEVHGAEKGRNNRGEQQGILN